MKDEVRCKRPRSGWCIFVKDEGGYTSLAVMIAVALAAVLCFSAIQVTWVSSSSSTIQHVADASALAAENSVAKYMTTAQVADAIILSLGLTALVLFLVATVLACIPYVQAFSDPVFEAGKDILSARNDFSQSALSTLNKLQEALPILMQVNASTLADANGKHIEGTSYKTVVLPFPVKGKPLECSAVELDSDTLQTKNAEAKTYAQDAEQYTEAARGDLERAFRADCVNDPSCLRERAGKLGGMSGASNPSYTSVESWSFAVPLARAQEYYRVRFLAEQTRGISSDPIEAGRDIARREFYAIAIEELAEGHANAHGDLSENLNIPILPRNTDDMKLREIYSDPRFPLSSNGSGVTLHYGTSCPGYKSRSASGKGSLSQLDSGAVSLCSSCMFSIKTLGEAPSASTNINNGFEYYYRIIALAAQTYRENTEKERACTERAKQCAQEVKPLLETLLKDVVGERIDPYPPGADGCVAVVVDPNQTSSPISLGLQATLPPRIAVSAATLKRCPNEEGESVLTNALSGLTKTSGEGGGQFTRPILSLWTSLLEAYEGGIGAIKGGITTFLSHIPGFSTSSDTTWGSGFVDEVLGTASLQPAETAAYKPVLTNSSRVLKSDPQLGASLARMQSAYINSPGEGSNDVIEDIVALVDNASRELEISAVDTLKEGFEFGTIKLFGPIEIPIHITLPESIIARGREVLDEMRLGLIARIRTSIGSTEGGWRTWQ